MQSLCNYMVSTADRDLETNSRATPLLFCHVDEGSSKKLYLYTTPHGITDQELKSSPNKVNTWIHRQAIISL